MANVKIDGFRVENKQRGRATLLAQFNVVLGPLTIRGFEVVQIDGKPPFVSVPNNSYKDREGKWNRYNHLVYNGPKGEQLQETIKEQALDELRRRSGATAAAPAATFDDDLPW